MSSIRTSSAQHKPWTISVNTEDVSALLGCGALWFDFLLKCAVYKCTYLLQVYSSFLCLAGIDCRNLCVICEIISFLWHFVICNLYSIGCWQHAAEWIWARWGAANHWGRWAVDRWSGRWGCGQFCVDGHQQRPLDSMIVNVVVVVIVVRNKAWTLVNSCSV